MQLNSPEGKAILALVRGAAYAHAGETEAIEIALSSMEKNPDRTVLDAGCGLGGTVDAMARAGWGRVTGIDIDAVAIERAREKFPGSTFEVAGVCEVGRRWREEFDLITCFNTVYAFPRQKAALASLAKAARPGARLVVFDYTDPSCRFAHSNFSHHEEAAFWQPLIPTDFDHQAEAAGWSGCEYRDLSGDYLRWYQNFVARIEADRSRVVTEFGEEAWEFVRDFYGALRDALADGTLGGGLFTFVRPGG